MMTSSPSNHGDAAGDIACQPWKITDYIHPSAGGGRFFEWNRREHGVPEDHQSLKVKIRKGKICRILVEFGQAGWFLEDFCWFSLKPAH